MWKRSVLAGMTSSPVFLQIMKKHLLLMAAASQLNRCSSVCPTSSGGIFPEAECFFLRMLRSRRVPSACERSGWSCRSSEPPCHCGPAGPGPSAPGAVRAGSAAPAARPPLSLRDPAAAPRAALPVLSPARGGRSQARAGPGRAGAALRGGAGLPGGGGPVCRSARERFRGSVIAVTLSVSVVITIIMTTLRAFTCDDLFRFNNM